MFMCDTNKIQEAEEFMSSNFWPSTGWIETLVYTDITENVLVYTVVPSIGKLNTEDLYVLYFHYDKNSFSLFQDGEPILLDLPLDAIEDYFECGRLQ